MTMVPFFARMPAHQRRLLPDRRLSGVTPWIIAILMMLTLLSAAAGLMLSNSANHLGEAIAGRVTVQITTSHPAKRAAQAQLLQERAAEAPFITHARAVAPKELEATLGQWFGSEGEADPVLQAMPLPALVDMDLAEGDRASQMVQLKKLVDGIADEARVIAHAEWLGPIERLIRSLAWVSMLMVVLITAASAAVVIMTARSALSTHYATIEMLHMIGSTDQQISRLFQHRIAIDTAYGIALGSGGAALILLIIRWQWSGITTGLASTATIGAGGWLLLLALPLLAIALAAVTARQTLLAALKKII
jgi:cell division transport system permease protein